MASQASDNALMELFPDPKPFRSLDLPDSTPLPGATEESTATLLETLKDNHKRWHTFFNDRGFHNHTAHGLLALWYLGADADILKAAYEQESSYQRATYASPGPINKDNWTEHLGDANYYDAYLAFFSAELAAKGPTAILEDYVFSEAVNYPENGKPVEMLARLLDGLIHPLIHVGYGYEFGVPGMIVEGLSQAAVHGATSTPILPASLWKESSSTKDVPNSTSNLLNILARIIADPEIAPTQGNQAIYKDIVQTYSSQILKHAHSWTIHVSTKEGLRMILEEIAWFVSLIFAVPGYTNKNQDGTFSADFFYMHLVTSSMFLSPLIAQLKPQSQKLLLQSYITVCLSWFISRGKPTLNIPSFFSSPQTQKSLITTTNPPYTTTTAPPSNNNNPLPSTSKISPNPWTEIIHLTLLHPDDHVPKLQRTLMHYGRLYGTRKTGHFKDAVELKGAEKIDGTLFVRAANLSALRLNKSPAPMKMGQETFQSYWDRRGFYKD